MLELTLHGYLPLTKLKCFDFCDISNSKTSILGYQTCRSCVNLCTMGQTQQQDLLLSASLLSKIDKLREKNIGKHVPLPQV